MTDKDLPAGEPWPQKQMLAFEKELIGFYISGHPLLACAWTLEKYNQCDVAGFAKLPSNLTSVLGGPLGGWLAGRGGGRFAMVVGGLVATAG